MSFLRFSFIKRLFRLIGVIAFIAIIVALLAGGIVGFVTFSRFQNALVAAGLTQHTTSEAPLRLIASPEIGSMYYLLAQELGYFEKKGVPVVLTLAKSSGEAAERFEKEQFDGFLGKYVDAVKKNGKTGDVSVIHATSVPIGPGYVVTSDNYYSIGGLRGKKIGVPKRYGLEHISVAHTFHDDGIAEKEIIVIEIPETKLLDALLKGQVDAIRASVATEEQAITKGFRRLRNIDQSVDVDVNVFAVRSETADKRAADIRSLLDGVFAAQDYARDNKVASLYFLEDQIGLPKQFIENYLTWLVLPDREENLLRQFSSANHPASLNSMGDYITTFLAAHNLVKTTQPSQAFLEPAFLMDKQEIFLDVLTKTGFSFMRFPQANALSLVMHIPEKYTDVQAGERVYFEIDIKYPENPIRKDLRMSYQIKNDTGLVAESQTLKAVENQASFLDFIVLPETADAGLHTMAVNISDYKNLQENVSSTFKVVEKDNELRTYFFIILSVVVGFGLLIMFQVSRIKRAQ